MAQPVRSQTAIGGLPEGTIVMSGGYVSPEGFPGLELAKIAADILRHRAAEALQYGEALHGGAWGYLPLRELIAGWLAEDHVEATPEDIMIVTGAKQNLDMCARAFCAAGGAIIVSEPAYMNGLKIFRTAGATLVPVESDEDGMDVDAVERILGSSERRGSARPSLIYCIPDFNNPDGTLMPEERRQKLVELGARYEVPILEDNPYRWTRFEGRPLLPLKHFDRQGIVISTGSFSKILAPGMRIGWVHSPRPLLKKIEAFKADGGTSPLLQMMAYEYYKDPGSLARHEVVVADILRARRNAILRSMDEHLRAQATWNSPLGGNYVWARFHEGIDTDALAPAAIAAGISYFRGSVFFARQDPPRNYMRLCFSLETEERIQTGVALLARVLRQHSQVNS